MTRLNAIRHEFVEFMPDVLDDGVLYVSIPYAIAVHKCCCGCGNEVATPFSPTDWRLIFNGESASLDPSIGNWSFPCQSHYWIKSGRVVWATRWSAAEIAAGRSRDRINKEEPLRGPGSRLSEPVVARIPSESARTGFLSGVWRKLRNTVSRHE